MLSKVQAFLWLMVAAAATFGLQPPQTQPKGVDVRGAALRAQEKADDKKAEEKYQRGWKTPTEEEKKRVHAAAAARHRNRVASLPTATPEKFDCRTMGWITPVGDQGNCGSCWAFATVDQISSAYLKAGHKDLKLSVQYILDCVPSGGCSGDWGSTVFTAAKAKGIPSEPDYGPYEARVRSCRTKAGTKFHPIADYGFCTPNQEYGVSTTQDIKNAIVQFGSVATAIAANNDWDGYRGGVMPFRRLTEWDVNHEVQIVGWDDTVSATGSSTKGVWIVKNSWSDLWGEKGYCRVGYGSHQIGTEATWVTVAALPPPPGPDPVPPPGPGGPGFTGSVTYTYKDGVLTGVSTGPNSEGVEADLKKAGISPATIVAFMKLMADLRSGQPREVIFADIIALILSLAPVSPPTPMGLHRVLPEWQPLPALAA